MDIRLDEIYKTVFQNSIFFLKKGIAEIVKNSPKGFGYDQAIISCLFVQMSIELGLKAFLIKEHGVKAILVEKYHYKTIEEIFISFSENTLRTKNYDVLKSYLRENELTEFKEIHFKHLDQFQRKRNKLVHLNLTLTDVELSDLRVELTFAVAQIIIPLLTELDFRFETPTEFYQEHLDGEQYSKLINDPAYIAEMRKIAKENTGLAYECLECFNVTFSPNNGICYSCTLDFSMAAQYGGCKICRESKSVIFDHLNIAQNDNCLDGHCLNCGDKPRVFKCPICEVIITHYVKDELIGTCFDGCLCLE